MATLRSLGGGVEDHSRVGQQPLAPMTDTYLTDLLLQSEKYSGFNSQAG